MKCEVVPMQFTFFSYETIIVSDYSFKFYNIIFQIKAGPSGATDVTKHLELSEITSFLWRGSDAAVVFHDFH